MDQIRAILASLSLKQKVSLALAAAAVIAGLVWLARWNKERDFKPLYTGLSAEDAGAVLSRLRESGVEYRLNENGSTVLVPSARVAELRLQMAAAGLPKTGRLGFELFDRSNLGATDFAEQVNYHRALEGELERSVMALSEVEQARVHVTLPKDSVFLENRQPAKAVVMVKLRPGARLSSQNVLAVTHLVSSAVEGLNPEAVSVLDMQGNLLNRPRRSSVGDQEPPEAFLAFRQQIEKDLLAKIHATLEPVLGPDRFRAGVYVDCDFSSAEMSEETLDASKSAPVTLSRIIEGSGALNVGGVPGTPSNLPRPTAPSPVTPSGVSRQTENVTYQNSRTVKHTKLPQGAIRKLSVSVLVDHRQRWEGSGANAKRVTEALPPERLKVIRDLVAGAIGFSSERGDQLIVETLPFETTLPEPPVAQQAPSAAEPANPLLALPLPPWLKNALLRSHFGVLAGMAGALLLALLLGGAYLWMRSRRKSKVSVTTAPAIEGASGSQAALEAGEEALEKRIEAQLAEQQALREQQAAEVLNSLKVQPVTTKKTEVLTKHIAEETKKDPAAMAQIVRAWLHEEER